MSEEGDGQHDLRRIANFARRLRRVALHPLVRDDQGALLRELMKIRPRVTVGGVGDKDTLRLDLVDEVMFESLAVRLRPLTLNDDPASYLASLKALDRVTRARDDLDLRATSKAMRREWKSCIDRKLVRAYWTAIEGTRYTDIDLAFAWLYQDSVHAEFEETGHLDVEDRFRAAVGVFSHLGVLALEMLHYLNGLVEIGVLDLPVGTFSDPVVVTKTELVQEVEVYETEVGLDVVDDVLAWVQSGKPLPTHVRRLTDSVAAWREHGQSHA